MALEGGAQLHRCEMNRCEVAVCVRPFVAASNNPIVTCDKGIEAFLARDQHTNSEMLHSCSRKKPHTPRWRITLSHVLISAGACTARYYDVVEYTSCNTTQTATKIRRDIRRGCVSFG